MDHERSSCGPATVNSVIIILINISLHEYYSYYYYYNNYTLFLLQTTDLVILVCRRPNSFMDNVREISSASKTVEKDLRKRLFTTARVCAAMD